MASSSSGPMLSDALAAFACAAADLAMVRAWARSSGLC